MTDEPAWLFLDHRHHEGLHHNILLQNVLVAIAYISTGYLGLKLASVGQSVTLFWAPSGIAFAALWIGQWRLLPSLVVGAFVVNMVTAKSVELAAVIAMGNTSSSILATFVLRRRLLAKPVSGELGRVMLFILLAVLAGTMLSAFAGTAAVSAWGHVNASVQSTWLVWWMGDAMGVLIVAPPILLWPRIKAASKDYKNLLDAICFGAAGFGVIAGLALIRNPIWAVELCKLFTLLLSLWAGARFGLNGPAGMTLLMAVGAVTVTALGAGPFIQHDLYDSFASVHSYLFAEAVAGMLLAAALSDLRRALGREHEALRKLEAASTNRIRFMSMISHDLRTPVAGIMDILQTIGRTNSTAEQMRLVAFGLRVGESLTKLIAAILDVVRADTGQLVVHNSIFSPAQSIADVGDMHRITALSKGLDLKIELAGSLPGFVAGDQMKFEQIVGNLVTNAITHTDQGQILLTAHFEQQLIVEVIDSGPGIHATLIPHIFDAFVTTKSLQAEGLGLGLHICRQLADLMQGEVNYYPVDPTGSRFRVSLPLRPCKPNVVRAYSNPTQKPGLRILLVDDDQIALVSTSALLVSLGHVVTTVESAEAAVRTAAAENFELILMDIHLGPAAMSGLDGTKIIRSLPMPRSDCLILGLTGDASSNESELYLKSGLDGVLLKPIDASLDLWRMVTDKQSKMSVDSSPIVIPFSQ